jgi:hypothetical protein
MYQALPVHNSVGNKLKTTEFNWGVKITMTFNKMLTKEANNNALLTFKSIFLLIFQLVNLIT